MTDIISISNTTNLSYSRSATGENWQLIMMSCTSAKCDPRSESNQSDCGSFFAYIYFVAFYMICSFLVSAVGLAMIKNAKLFIKVSSPGITIELLIFLDHQFIRGSHHG
jgi:hypothetical protein